MGIAEILTIIFVIFKLVGVISWSWWLVFIPMYIAGALYIGMFVLWIIGAGMTMKFLKKEKWFHE